MISPPTRTLTGERSRVFCRVPRRRISVLDVLSLSPCAWNHDAREARVDSMRWIRLGRLRLTSDTRIWVSSAYWVT